MFLIFHPAVQSLYSLLNFQVGAKIDQSQRLTSWRGNLLCFSYSRGNIISFTACLVERRTLVNFFALKISYLPVIMSVMKDITNLSSNTAASGHESSPERDIFVSLTSPSSRKRKAEHVQASMQKFLQKPETLGSTGNEDQIIGSEADCGVNSVFMTPETPQDGPPKVSKPNRKRLRLGGPRNESQSPSLSVTLNGLTKAQLVDILETLVAERHPDLEQVNFNLKIIFLNLSQIAERKKDAIFKQVGRIFYCCVDLIFKCC